LIRLVPRTATDDDDDDEDDEEVSVDQVGSKDSDMYFFRFRKRQHMCPLIRLVPRTATPTAAWFIMNYDGVSVDQVGSKDSDEYPRDRRSLLLFRVR